MPSKRFLSTIIFFLSITIISVMAYMYFINQPPVFAVGNIINAASCLLSDVQTAVNMATDGDTVSIPAGACTWSGSVDIGTGTSRTKMVKLVGAGTDASTGTRITCNSTCIGAWLRNGLAGIDISYIRFIEGTSGEPWAIQLSGHVDVYDSLFRIHHNYFQYASGSADNAIIIGGLNKYNSAYDLGHPYIWGLIDNNTFKADATTQGIDIMPLYSADLGFPNGGHTAWKLWELSDHQGTWRNVYVEDNLIDSRPGWRNGTAFIDSTGGGAYVFRHNTIYNNWVANHGPQWSRGHKWYEIYDNVFVLDYVGDAFNGVTNSRGGTGVIFNNQFYDTNRKGFYVGLGTDDFEFFMNMQYYRYDFSVEGVDGVCAAALCGNDPKVGCDNKDNSTGWICRDQVGARKGASELLFAFGYRWETEPIMEWNNNHSLLTEFSCSLGCGAILEERDFINHDTCSDNIDNDGDGYIDMADQECSVFWDNTNNKKKNYISYTYPHPLTLAGGGTPDISSPSTPANLSATVVSSNQINLSWTASTDNIGVSDYRIYRCTGSGCAPTTQITTSAVNSYSDTGLSPSTTYTYAISAYDAAGNNSSQSSSISATTQAQSPIITIGETNILPTSDSGNGNLLIAQSATLSQSATIQSLSFYVTSASGNLRLGIYDTTGPSGGPGQKKAETNEITPIIGWNTANVTTPVVLNSGTYWLAYLPSSSALAFRKASDASSSGKYYNYTYAPLPNIFSSTLNSTASHWSFYATLNTAADTTPPSAPTGLVVQ